MKKLQLIYLLLLLPLFATSQVSTGMETDFDYGLRNLAPQEVTTPTYLCTQGIDGTIGRIPSAYIEKTSNKQNNLNYDGTGAKYPTVDGVNDWAVKVAKVATKTGLLSKFDTFNLIPLTNSTLRISAVESAIFWNELFVVGTAPSSAVKAFAQKDYVLTQLITATGGNVNLNPLTTDGKYIRYLGYDKLGNVYSSGTSLFTNNDILQIGFVTVLKTGSTVEFLDGTAGPRHVLAQPNLASNTDFDKVTETKTNVTVGRKSNASFSTTSGTITGISVNWKSAQNPSNGNPIDVFNYTGQTTASFVAIDPTFLTSTSAITTHSLLTELDGGIAVNESFYNTTTGLRGTMANGSAAVARIMVGVRGGIFWQMGEFATTACYSDLATAKSNIYSHVFSEAIVPPGVAYEIARVAYTKGFTVTNSDTQFYLVNTGGSGSGGSSTIPPVSDATVATKGILKLAGDFDASSTADVPVIKPASASQNGLVTTGNQSFVGEKSVTVNSSGNAFFAQNDGAGVAVKGTSQTGNSGQFLSSGSSNATVYASNLSSGDIYVGNNIGGEVYRVDNSGNLTANRLFFRNVANTFTSSFTNTNTASRTYTLPDVSGTIALDTSTMLLTGNQSFSGTKTSSQNSASISSTYTGSSNFVGAISGTANGGGCALLASSSAGTGLRVDHSGSSSGVKLFSSGSSVSLNVVADSSGDIINATSTSGSTLRFKVSNLGVITGSGVISTGVVRLMGYTVATLPAGTIGDTAYVTDATAPTFLATVVGGGSVKCPVFFDGTNWIAH